MTHCGRAGTPSKHKRTPHDVHPDLIHFINQPAELAVIPATTVTQEFLRAVWHDSGETLMALTAGESELVSAPVE